MDKLDNYTAVIYRNYKDRFNLNDKIILGINSQENSKIFNSMVLLDHNLNIIKKGYKDCDLDIKYLKQALKP